jgi:hypothetical protein
MTIFCPHENCQYAFVVLEGKEWRKVFHIRVNSLGSEVTFFKWIQNYLQQITKPEIVIFNHVNTAKLLEYISTN